jgi:mRNA interferase RelE/StbE
VKLAYEACFEKDLKNISDKNLLKKIKSTIEEIRKTDKLSSISNLKKLRGYETFYRIRIGDYRIGIEIIEDCVIFTRVLHRKEVYIPPTGIICAFVKRFAKSFYFKIQKVQIIVVERIDIFHNATEKNRCNYLKRFCEELASY